MSNHYCISSPCKICFPDPIDPMPTAQKPYVPCIKLDEDYAKVAEINRQEGLERLANALAMAWEHNSKLRDEINTLKERLEYLESSLRSLRLHCEAVGLAGTENKLKQFGLWVDVSDVGRYQ